MTQCLTTDHVAPAADTFKGDNAKLIECIAALLSLDEQGVLKPHGVGAHARVLMSAAAARLAVVAPARQYADSTSELHVSDSSFEDWYQAHPKAYRGDKQFARDSYAAGMGDPLVVNAATCIPITPSEIQSGVTRVRWAELLIRQLPVTHEGRNSWLLNYSALPRAKVPTPICARPPAGWQCSRKSEHEGPCAAHPVLDESPLETGEGDAR